MTLVNCPNSSKLTLPNRPDQTISALLITSSGTPGSNASRIWAASAANEAGTGGWPPPSTPARYASLMIRP
jgi:hypothetical protein